MVAILKNGAVLSCWFDSKHALKTRAELRLVHRFKEDNVAADWLFSWLCWHGRLFSLINWEGVVLYGWLECIFWLLGSIGSAKIGFGHLGLCGHPLKPNFYGKIIIQVANYWDRSSLPDNYIFLINTCIIEADNKNHVNNVHRVIEAMEQIDIVQI